MPFFVTYNFIFVTCTKMETERKRTALCGLTSCLFLMSVIISVYQNMKIAQATDSNFDKHVSNALSGLTWDIL